MEEVSLALAHLHDVYRLQEAFLLGIELIDCLLVLQILIKLAVAD